MRRGPGCRVPAVRAAAQCCVPRDARRLGMAQQRHSTARRRRSFLPGSGTHRDARRQAGRTHTNRTCVCAHPDFPSCHEFSQSHLTNPLAIPESFYILLAGGSCILHTLITYSGRLHTFMIMVPFSFTGARQVFLEGGGLISAAYRTRSF